MDVQYEDDDQDKSIDAVTPVVKPVSAIVTEETLTKEVPPEQSSINSMSVVYDDAEVEEEVVQVNGAVRDSAGNLLPVAYDPSEQVQEILTVDRGRNPFWKSVRADIVSETKRRASLSVEQLEKENEEVSDLLRNAYKLPDVMLEDGTIVENPNLRKAGLLENAIAMLPTSWVLGFGNFVQEMGAVAKDDFAQAMRQLQKMSPSAFDKFDSAITGGRYKNAGDPYALAEFVADGAIVGGEFGETLIGLSQITSLIQKADVVGYRTTAAMLRPDGVNKEIARLDRVDASTAQKNINKLFSSREEADIPPELVALVDKAKAAGIKPIINSDSTEARYLARALSEDALAAGEINNPGGARIATMAVAREKQNKAAEIAAKHPELAESVIRSHEAQMQKVNPDYKISKTVFGRLVVDPDLVRKQGREIAQVITERDGPLFDLSLGETVVTSPILRPDKFNGLIAAGVRLREKIPDVFDNDAPLIDNLFSLMASKELPIEVPELINILDEFNLSIEDYTLMLVSGGSDAGTILGKISQLRNKTTGVRGYDRDKVRLEKMGNFRRKFIRFEGVRRGGLVSQFATMNRNLFTSGVRIPLESFGNVVDNAIFAGQGLGRFSDMKASPRIQGKAGEIDSDYSEPSATKRFTDQVFSGENWSDSFRTAQLMFSRSDLAEEYTDLILSQPQLAKTSSRLFNNLNEIQKYMGKGDGGIADVVLTELEGVVEMLNLPNRWQEHLTRRSIFFGELERLAKREYGIELQKALDEGQLNGLLNDSSNSMPRPKGAKSFIHLVDEAANKALDLTYASEPEVPLFASMARGITEWGGTIIVPFPRFMFKSMELMGQYSLGGPLALRNKIKKVVTLGMSETVPLTAKDRQRISRNLQGLAIFGAAYMYRNMEGAPEQWEEIGLGESEDGTRAQLNTIALYPLGPSLYVAEQAKRIRLGTFLDRFDIREFFETFTGSNFRAGSGNSIFEELAQLASSVDLTKGEATGRAIGRQVGNYVGTWPVSLAQVIDLQRITGKRGVDFKETAKDPTFDFWDSVWDNTLQPIRRYMGAEEESLLPKKEYANFPDGRTRLAPYLKPFGFTITNRPPPDNEYLMSLGIDWKIAGSKSKVPAIKNYEIKMTNSVLNSISHNAQQYEAKLRREYGAFGEGSHMQNQFTEKEYVYLMLRPRVIEQVKSYKKIIREGSVLKGSRYARAMMAYRKLRPDYRKLATPIFLREQGYFPDPTVTRDLELLTKYGEIYEDEFTK